MKNLITSMFMIFSLMIAPVAHADGIGCAGESKKIEFSSIQKVSSEDSKETDNKGQPCAHCYCCSHTLADGTAAKIIEPNREVTRLAIVTKDDMLTSLSVGPPSEPPLHA